jgi:hypothetical protein
MNNKNIESKDQKFKRLATQRVNKALKMLDLIANLSNRSNYHFNDEEADRIINALNQSLLVIKMKFKNKKNTFKI